ncbi:metal dependent amidohydrolase [Nemania sp. FL0031]|nr:metal dependent amidohydrolase [Nemania sp. FL0031]
MGRLLHLLLLTASLFQPTSAKCHLLKRGVSRDILLLGTVLTTEGASPNSAIFIQDGEIAYVGDLCGPSPRGITYASVVDCNGGKGKGAAAVISPGFINTHEHIAFSTFRPFPDTGERVSHRHDWRVGARGHTLRAVAVNGSIISARAWGELRHLFSGTTSIVGGDMAPGLARNLDFSAGLGEGLSGRREARYDTFPLRDGLGLMRNGDCDYGADAIDREAARKYHRYIGHIGEGVDLEAANEFACLSNMTFDPIPAPAGGGLSTDIIAPNVALVHALGLTPRDFDIVAARRAKVVWSPRSNMYLYGKTLNVSYLLDAGITVALGTDWLPSGSATMGREAVCAAAVAYESFGTVLTPKTLWEMATVNAAEVAGFGDRLGALEVGKLADIVVFGGALRDGGEEVDPFAQAIFATQEKVELVSRGGKIILASSELKNLTSETCEMVAFGKSEKVVCVADELGSSFKELEDSLQGVYPAVLPEIPIDEPTCKLYSLPI